MLFKNVNPEKHFAFTILALAGLEYISLINSCDKSPMNGKY